MRSSRKGQATAGGTAVLVALMGAIIIAYILTLPPDARSELLQGGNGAGGAGGYGGGGGGSGPLLILAETPGTLMLQASPVVEHSLPSTTVFTSTQTVAIKELSSLNIKNSLFSRQGASFSFDAGQLMADHFLLSFNVDEAQGNLIILLNGREIFNQEIEDRSPQPIILPKDYLAQGKNEVAIFVGDVGFKFWSSNEYQLRNILVSADALDFAGAVSEQHFTLPEQEYNQLEYAQLSLIPECNPQSAGRLIMEVNDRLIYSGYPDCGILNRVDVAKEFVRLGDNKVVFVSEQGSYLLDRIEVVSYLQEQDYPLYYFNLPLDLYEPLDIGDNELLVTMRFADYRTEKRGEIIINGFVQAFQAGDYVYQAVIDPNILVPGPNTIQVVPHVNRLNVAEVKIEMI